MVSSALSPFCRPEEDPFLLLESSLKAIERILLRRRGLPLRRTWIEQPYGEEEITLLEEEVIPAIQQCLARLLQQGHLALQASSGTWRTTTQPPAHAHPLEQTLHAQIAQGLQHGHPGRLVLRLEAGNGGAGGTGGAVTVLNLGLQNSIIAGQTAILAQSLGGIGGFGFGRPPLVALVVWGRNLATSA